MHRHLLGQLWHEQISLNLLLPAHQRIHSSFVVQRIHCHLVRQHEINDLLLTLGISCSFNGQIPQCELLITVIKNIKFICTKETMWSLNSTIKTRNYFCTNFNIRISHCQSTTLISWLTHIYSCKISSEAQEESRPMKDFLQIWVKYLIKFFALRWKWIIQNCCSFDDGDLLRKQNSQTNLADELVFFEPSFLDDESFVLEDVRPSFFDFDDLFSLTFNLRDSFSESEPWRLSIAYFSEITWKVLYGASK